MLDDDNFAMSFSNCRKSVIKWLFHAIMLLMALLCRLLSLCVIFKLLYATCRNADDNSARSSAVFRGCVIVARRRLHFADGTPVCFLLLSESMLFFVLCDPYMILTAVFRRVGHTVLLGTWYTFIKLTIL